MTESKRTKKVKSERLSRASSNDDDSAYASVSSSSLSTGTSTPCTFDDNKDSTWGSPNTYLSAEASKLEYKQENDEHRMVMAQHYTETIHTQRHPQSTSRSPTSRITYYIASIEPSALSFSSRILAHLHLRIQNIWGDRKSFDTRGMQLFGKKDFPSLTALTVASISEYFGVIAPQMALCVSHSIRNLNTILTVLCDSIP